MKNYITKISLIILTGLIIFGCNSIKRVPAGKSLLTKNTIYIDGKKTNQEEIYNLLYQKENSTLLGYPLRLNIYNLAKPKTDSIYKAKFAKNPEKYYRKSKWLSKKQVKRLGESFWYSGIHNFLRKTGEAPVTLDTINSIKSVFRLKSYYFNRGYFDVAANFTIDSLKPKKVKVNYNITLGKPYIIDSIHTTISSHPLDSIFQLKKKNALLKTSKKFEKENFDEEIARMTTDFRNNGAFRFQQNYITFDIDTLKNKHTSNVELIVGDENIRKGDSTYTKPFQLYKIKKVNVFTNYNPSDPNSKITDSTSYKDFTIYSVSKLKYRPKAIADGIFMNTGEYFSDTKTTLTSKYLSNLRVFNYPLIQYEEDKKNKNELITNIYLTSRKKYTFGISSDFTHSNIQQFGISGNASLSIRNIFNGAETFELSLRGEVGSQKGNANPKNNFFNTSELGADAKVNFPRLFLPFNSDKIIPKAMLPYSTLGAGYSKQTNIGLDKMNLTNSLTYFWTPKKNSSFRFDILNIQFVKNINPSNYYNVYKSSYNTLNDLAIKYDADPSYFDPNGNLIVPTGVESFLSDVNNGVITTSPTDASAIRSIQEQQQRLTENNLIFSSSISYFKTSKKDLLDNNFYSFRVKFESAGNLLSLISNNNNKGPTGAHTFFGVEYSQYLKTEFEFIKHWQIAKKQVFATRAFFGIAVPYGNVNSVPFSRSYFAGGSNDIRAWQSYRLGPGKTNSVNDYNEANMKITLNTEFRFNIFQQINGSLFIDAGNIWHINDIVTNPDAIFSGLQSLKNSAIGTGFGVNYDFEFFVMRFDLGFKTYNPALPENEKWLKEMRFDKSVLNIGINYPF